MQDIRFNVGGTLIDWSVLSTFMPNSINPLNDLGSLKYIVDEFCKVLRGLGVNSTS